MPHKNKAEHDAAVARTNKQNLELLHQIKKMYGIPIDKRRKKNAD